MNVDKAKKRIAKQVKKRDNGYPRLTIEYFGQTAECATEVEVSFTLDEDSLPQKQRFVSTADAREDETIQSALVKIMERAGANTVTQVEGIGSAAAPEQSLRPGSATV